MQPKMWQEMRQMPEMMERMHISPNRNHRDNDAHDDDGIRVRPIPHQRPAPINQPLVYEDLSDDEDFAEVVFRQKVGVGRRGEGRRGAGRDGAGFRGYERGGVGHMGNVYEGVGYRDVYGEQPRRQDHGREEFHEYWMKIDLPSFNRHLQIERFLRLGDGDREVLWLYEYSGGSQGEVIGIQVQGKSFCLVGKVTDFSRPTREGTHNFMVEDEAATQSTIFTIGLWATTIPAIPRV
jgi:hypothetical protein